MAKPLHVAMIGTGFMGRAHSQAWHSVSSFFNLPRKAKPTIVCGRDLENTHEFASQWGWPEFTTDLGHALNHELVELVDVVTPNHFHRDHALAALEAGRHVACEKPLAGTLKEARMMAEAARTRKRGGQLTFVWFNYRRCPAIAFAHQLVKGKKLGRVFHVRATYLQDWGGSATPHSWRFQGKLAGSGAHGDLNAHLVDMARFITGDEITEVAGAIEATFIKDRMESTGRKRATSSVDDAVLFLARFKGGATASFEATRLATGNLNRNTIEVNGEKGSIKFDFERMNELQWWDHALDPGLRGWSTINCTQPGSHPYVDAYWPPGHGIGYEHTFISQSADILRVLSGKKPIVPLADFEDAYQTQRVLEAALISARERCAIKLSDVR